MSDTRRDHGPDHGDGPDCGPNDDTRLPGEAHHDSDPLSLLTQAWGQVTPPDATPGLAAESEAVQDSVAWVQRSWARLEAPPAKLPLPLRLATSRAAPWRRLGAAAALLLALVLGRGLRPDRIGAPGPASGPTDGLVDVTSRSATPRVVAVTDDHIELRSGHVRLVLITNSTTRDADDGP